MVDGWAGKHPDNSFTFQAGYKMSVTCTFKILNLPTASNRFLQLKSSQENHFSLVCIFTSV